MGKAVSYLRTSSATNVAGDSAPRQRQAIAAYAERCGLEVEREFYDAAVSGADPVGDRPGFAALMAFLAETGIATVLVENASRFARDLVVQETGYAMLGRAGIALVAVDDPDAFTADTPTACMVRQILGAVAQFEKANLVAKLKSGRDRASARLGRRCEGRPGYRQTDPALVAAARRFARRCAKTGKAPSLRAIASMLADSGHVSSTGKPLTAAQVGRLLHPRTASTLGR